MMICRIEMGKVFVGGLSRETTTVGLREYFERFGDISDCVVMKDRNTNLPRGFEIADISYGDGQALIYGTKENGEQTLYLFDINTGRMAADVEIRFD